MKVRQIRVTAETVERLMALFRDLPPHPVGEHLTDEEFIAYAMRMLSAEEVERLDAHLASCPDCAAEVERLLEGSAVWQGEEGRQRLAALRERVLGSLLTPEPPSPRERLRRYLQEATAGWRTLFAARRPAWAAETGEAGRREIWRWQSEDGRLRGHAVWESSGRLTLRFVTDAPDLEGQRFELRVGDRRYEMVLQRVSETEVGAKVVIPAPERADDLADISLEAIS